MNFYEGTAQYYSRYRPSYPFISIEEHFLNETRHWNLENIKGFLYSTANCSKQMLGESISDFENDLNKSLLNIKSDGKFIEEAILSVVLAKK